MAGGAAARLDRMGVGRGEPVAVCDRKSPETIALVLACMLTGRPALLPSPDLRPEVLAEVVQSGGAQRVLEAETGEEAEIAAVPAHSGDVALLLTTSGSTGLPKVVPLTYGAVNRFAAWASGRFGIGAEASVLSYCGLNFDLSLLEVWTTLKRGGCCVLVAQERSAQGTHVLDLVEHHSVEVVQGVPTLYRLLIDAAGGRSLPAVRHVILTGDTMPLRTLERLPGLFPNARLHSVYGCTETNDSFVYEVEVARVLELGAMPLGDPLPGVKARIVRDGALVEGTGSGELWVSTPFQTTGYRGAHARAGAFVRDRSGRVWFRSGDLVRRDASGATFLQGRTDMHVKVLGVRVNLQEVEQTLLEHPDVTEAAVVAFDDDLAGKRAHAVVRRRRGAGVNALRLRSHCARRLTRVAIPSTIEVQEEPLPRTITGKVDRGAVRSHAKAGAHG
jgi:acyl-coenzyme A synthetase/AMP-(fatty) acid ligase